MPTVAHHPRAVVLAPAEEHRAIRLSLVRFRREIRPLVRAITERLIGALPARTPVVRLARLNLHWIGPFFGDFRCAHYSLIAG